MSSCSRSQKSNLSKKLQKQVTAHLKSVIQLYPGTSFVALVGPRQELIDYETTQNAFELKKERERLENMLGIVASLRHASLEVGTLLKQRNVQPIVTVRGADRAFLCYPVGDDKVLVFYVDAAFDVPLRSNPLTASTNSNELSSSNDNSTAAPPTPDHDDEVEADEMTKICADLHQLLIGVKFSSLAASSSASSSAVSSSSSSKAKS